MKHFFKSLLAIILPWVIILMDDNPGGAILALFLQVTLIGWILASIWAWKVLHKPTSKTQKTKES